MKKSNVIIALVILLIFTISVQSNAKVTASVENFSLKDYKGKTFSLSEFKESKAIVVMFIATRCPVSNAYNSRMEKLYNDYSDKNVSFLGINSNKAEGVAEIRKHSIENRFKFPILKDVDNVIADRFEASVTPEVYILNSDLKILYHGRIDDSRRESEVSSEDLRKALDEIIASNEVSLSKTKAFGCSIKRVDK